MEIPQLIIICIASAVIIIVGIFKKQERALRTEFFDRTQILIDAIAMHRTQISIRQRALNIYDFLKYNISEALLIQSKINLDV